MTNLTPARLTHRELFHKAIALDGPPVFLNWEFGFWKETIARWLGEGLPPVFQNAEGFVRGGELLDYFGVMGGVYYRNVRYSFRPHPRFTEELIAEDACSKTIRNVNGVIVRQLKAGGSMPQFLRFPVETLDDWNKLKAERFRPDDQTRLKEPQDVLVKRANNGTDPIGISLTGFFGFLRDIMGFEGACLAYYDRPELVQEIYRFWTGYLTHCMARFVENVRLDYVVIWEDMSYKTGSIISPAAFREFLLPYYKELTGYLRAAGIETIFVDSDGDVEKLIPLFMEGGVNALFPFECVPGLDLFALREEYPALIISGGIDKKALSQGRAAIDRELEHKMPLVARGRFIPTVDHGVPPDVSLDNFKYYLKRKCELGEKYVREGKGN